jgi:tetratricopeptide (TPR) repeat protein
MKQFCAHHPTKAAHFQCPKCAVSFCKDCVAKREKGGIYQGEVLYLCPKCMISTDWIGASNLIEPFWTRLPKFFSYPLSLRPLGLIIGVSLAGLIFSAPGFITMMIQIAIWGILLKYSYASLKATAKGDLVPPKLDSQTLSEDFFLVFKQIWIFIAVFFGFIFIQQSAGTLFSILYLIVAILSIPAMIIIFVTTESLINAINPMLFIPLAFRIGWGYLLMYFFLILLLSAPAALAQFAGNILPLGLTAFLLNLGSNYYTIISYHLMGYVILQYHKEIGYTIEFQDFRETETSEEEDSGGKNSGIVNQVNFMLKEGHHDEALALIQQEERQRGITDPDLSEYYFKLLLMKNQVETLLAHGKRHLGILIQKNEKKKACETFLQCLEKDPKFLPEASILFKVGGWLNESGKSKEAIGVYNRLIKSFPDATLVPKTLFQAAKVYNDRLMNPGKAEKILTATIKKYPNHEFIPHIQSYLSQMKA